MDTGSRISGKNFRSQADNECAIGGKNVRKTPVVPAMGTSAACTTTVTDIAERERTNRRNTAKTSADRNTKVTLTLTIAGWN